MEFLPGFKVIAAALAAFPLGLVALAVGKVFVTMIEAIARNPSARDKIFPIGMIGFALTEAIALFILTVVFLILFA